VIWNAFREQVYRSEYEGGNGIDVGFLSAGVYLIQAADHAVQRFVKI